MARPVADILVSLGFDVAAWTRTPKPGAKIEVFHGRGGLGAFLGRTDIVLCMLPLTEETRGILDASAFGQLREGASVINLGRGEHVVTDDLIAALDRGQLAGATLDVTHPEPLPEDSPLWDHPKVTVLPHVARRPPVGQVAPRLVENIRLFEAGEPLVQRVDRDAGY